MEEILIELRKYEKLKEEVRNMAEILIEENPKNKEVVFKILDDIRKDKEVEIPYEIGVEDWGEDYILFTDGLIHLKIARKDGKFTSTIEGCWFGSPKEEPFQLPIKKESITYNKQLEAIAKTIIRRGDIVNRYYFPYGLDKIKNVDEVCANPHYEDWRDIIFSENGLCGLDFIDIHKAIKNKVCTLYHIAIKDIEHLPNSIDFDKKVSNCLIAIKMPRSKGLTEINKIAETITGKLDDDCQVLWQAINHNKKNYEMIVLYN